MPTRVSHVRQLSTVGPGDKDDVFMHALSGEDKNTGGPCILPKSATFDDGSSRTLDTIYLSHASCLINL